MARITNARLTIAHDHSKKTAKATVKAKINFTPFEYCLMKNCPETRLFKLQCELWGEDFGLTGEDDYLYTYSNVFFYPDGSPTQTESVTFTVTVGEGVLDEDWGTDEVYGILILRNLFTYTKVMKKTNVVSHSF